VFPVLQGYGRSVYGAVARHDELDEVRLVPPVFMPDRLAKLIELGREPTHADVSLATVVGGFSSPLPVYVSAFGSTSVGNGDLALAVSRQAGAAGIPMVVGENVLPVHGYRTTGGALLDRVRAYTAELSGADGGVVVQQSTEDADAEVWNLVYSDPSTQDLLASGRLGFELKVGQGAKPGLGGLTVLDRRAADRLRDRYALADVFGADRVLRLGTAGTFTEEIMRQQIRLMRNNFPRARVWVKLGPGRDVGRAAAVAWAAGADAVTVDGAEGGTGWAPLAFLDGVGLPVAECLRRVEPGQGCLLVSGRMWDGARAVKCLALGGSAVGLGRAALVSVDEEPGTGLRHLLDCLELEIRMLVSALGKYTAGAVDAEDVWPAPGRTSR
jgi:hypothetical protein